MFTENKGPETVNQNGWICPICKRVYNPNIKECPICTQQSIKENVNSGKVVLLG